MNRGGQSTIEVVVLLLVVAAAVFLMRNYINRAMQGKLKESADKIGSLWDYNASDDSIVTETQFRVDSETVETYDDTGARKTEYKKFEQNQNIIVNLEALSNLEDLGLPS